MVSTSTVARGRRRRVRSCISQTCRVIAITHGMTRIVGIERVPRPVQLQARLLHEIAHLLRIRSCRRLKKAADRRRQQHVQLIERREAARLVADHQRAELHLIGRPGSSHRAQSTDLPLPSRIVSGHFSRRPANWSGMRHLSGRRRGARCVRRDCRRLSGLGGRAAADAEPAAGPAEDGRYRAGLRQARRRHDDPPGVHRFLRRRIDRVRARSGAGARVDAQARTPPQPPGLELHWEPRLGDVAASGDLGYLTGPAEYVMPGKPNTYTCYFSVWKRQPDGEFRVILDIGVPTPEKTPFAPGLRALGGGDVVEGPRIARTIRGEPHGVRQGVRSVHRREGRQPGVRAR